MIQLALSTASTFSVTLRLAPSLPWRAAHESVMRVTASTELTLYLGLSHRHLQPSARPEDLRQASTPFIDSNATANFTSHLETALTMEDQHNLLGAIVFWLYIALALIFSFFAIESILKAPSPAPHKHVATFSIMAAISFSTLSFNMLHVLIDSYSTWSERQVIPLVLSPSSIWQWSITSTLFRNFGEAIVLDDARFLWTQCALMATMSVSFFMGAEGMLSSSHIPYFVRSRWTFLHCPQGVYAALITFVSMVAVEDTERALPKILSTLNSTGVLASIMKCAHPLRQVYAIESRAYGPSLLYRRSCLSHSH